MKCLLLSLLLVFLSSYGYTIDTDLGKIDATPNQIKHITDLIDANIQGFAYYPEEKRLVVVTIIEPTVEDMDIIRNNVMALSDEPVESKTLVDEVASLKSDITQLNIKTGVIKVQ